MKTAIFLNNRNRFFALKEMCKYASKYPDSELFIVDNNSEYPPLLEWYKTCEYNLIKLNKNGTNCAPWTEKILDRYQSSFDYYVVSDCDLDMSSVPIDVLSVLQEGLRKYKIYKSGISIKIDDIPSNSISSGCAEWEKKFWIDSLDNTFYKAQIATTFALYDFKNLLTPWSRDAIRSKPPYTCRHYPWYITPENITEEDKFYLKKLEFRTHWTTKMKKKLKL